MLLLCMPELFWEAQRPLSYDHSSPVINNVGARKRKLPCLFHFLSPFLGQALLEKNNSSFGSATRQLIIPSYHQLRPTIRQDSDTLCVVPSFSFPDVGRIDQFGG